ncbi:uncharacterized protein CPUR_04481 [Claviceps purpurea 20.1]|uniref:Uncharacterized protein n=1 Tax=Claviceps purpurea (strain 20.1) TaxID=1111077 RepID=M1VW45_CLAP2|nr:uncharacterized protein CPUR_04481 [Claviceps purpurea 20.1]
MATPPQGAGNSHDLRTPVNATQGARDFLFSGSTPLTVGQDANRLIAELDRDRAS